MHLLWRKIAKNLLQKIKSLARCLYLQKESLVAKPTSEATPVMLELQKLQVAKHMWTAQFIELLSPPVLQICQQKGMHGKASCLQMTDILWHFELSIFPVPVILSFF